LAAASKILEHTVLYVPFLQFLWLVIMQKFTSLWPKWKYAFAGEPHRYEFCGRKMFIHAFCILRYHKKHQLFIDFKKAYDSVKREALYSILIEFGIPKKLVRLIKMCLTETYS
jgi:hypothetical protein